MTLAQLVGLGSVESDDGGGSTPAVPSPDELLQLAAQYNAR